MFNCASRLRHPGRQLYNMSTVVTRAASSTSAKPALQKRSRSTAGAAGGKKPSGHTKRPRLEQMPADSDEKDDFESHGKAAASQGRKKWQDYNQHNHQLPFPDFARPTHEECEHAHSMLEDLHGDTVRENFASDVESVKYPHVMDAVVVAALSQATSWENAKRAMRNMDLVYGSTFAYDLISQGGEEKLRQALRSGGMQNRKAVIFTGDSRAGEAKILEVRPRIFIRGRRRRGYARTTTLQGHRTEMRPLRDEHLPQAHNFRSRCSLPSASRILGLATCVRFKRRGSGSPGRPHS